MSPDPTPPPAEPAPSLRPVEELQALCDAATAGPWEAYFTIHGDPYVVPANRPWPSSQIAEISTAARDYGRADALFIAAARTALPSLLAENARLAAADRENAELRGEVERLRGVMHDWAGDIGSAAGRIEAAEARLEAVRAVHERSTTAPFECLEDGEAWPCDTLRAAGIAALSAAPQPEPDSAASWMTFMDVQVSNAQPQVRPDHNCVPEGCSECRPDGSR